MDKNTTYKATGKITIIPIAERDRDTGAQRWFRDENGTTHAEAFQASMLDASDPKKRRYLRWRVTAQEAEALANQPLGTVFAGEFAQSYVADENGAVKADVYESTVNGADYKKALAEAVFERAESKAINADGTTAEPSTHEVWQGNGEKIAFIKSKSPQTLGEYGLCRVNPDGSDREYFTNSCGFSLWHCSPTYDGNFIAEQYVTVNSDHVKTSINVFNSVIVKS